MNSNSRYIENACRDDRRDSDSRKRRPQVGATLKCSAPGSATIPALTAPGTTFRPTSLMVNNSNFCNPCTKLEFTSNITVPIGFIGTLSFQIFKQCRNQMTAVPVGPAFNFSRTAALTIGEASTFSFFVCDCDDCNDDDCCTYTVVVTNLSAITLGLTITNATLSALTANQTNRNCC